VDFSQQISSVGAVARNPPTVTTPEDPATILHLPSSVGDPASTTHAATRADQHCTQGRADMVRYASEFGIGPLARSRIAAGIGPQPPHRKFDGRLKQPWR
jgi:hypothetical protein